MTSFVLKIVASVTMLIDHTGVLLQYCFDTTLFRVVGRIAFPLYIFMVSEGCRRTRDIKKYFMSLLIFALLSEIVFDMFFSTVNNFMIYETIFFDPSSQNVFFTLALGVLAIWYYNSHKIDDTGKIAPIHFIPLLLICAGGDFLCTDYGSVGVITIFLCGVFTKRIHRVMVLVAGFLLLYAVHFSLFYIQMLLGAMLSLPFIFLYNGERGHNIHKWFFYFFYPAHLLIFYLIWHFYVSKIFVF